MDSAATSVMQLNVDWCREGWREPIDMEIELAAFLEVLADAPPDARATDAPRIRMLVPDRSLPVFAETAVPSSRSTTRVVEVDRTLVERGLRVMTPMGVAIVRMKPLNRESILRQLSRIGP